MEAAVISDPRLANALIERLNGLLQSDPSVAPVLQALIEARLRIEDPAEARMLREHPTIQAGHAGDDPAAPIETGFLGILNGIVGSIPESHPKFAGWGYICAVYGNDGRLLYFSRTDAKGIEPRDE